MNCRLCCRSIRPHAGMLLSIWPETFSYTLSELMRLGVPPVATRVGGFAERIIDGETGYLVEPTADDLVARLKQLDADRASLSPCPHQSRRVATPWRGRHGGRLPSPAAIVGGRQGRAGRAAGSVGTSRHARNSPGRGTLRHVEADQEPRLAIDDEPGCRTPPARPRPDRRKPAADRRAAKGSGGTPAGHGRAPAVHCRTSARRRGTTTRAGRSPVQPRTATVGRPAYGSGLGPPGARQGTGRARHAYSRARRATGWFEPAHRGNPLVHQLAAVESNPGGRYLRPAHPDRDQSGGRPARRSARPCPSMCRCCTRPGDPAASSL